MNTPIRIAIDFSKLFERDLNRLKNEINSYPSDEELWSKRGEINNSAGNLSLHVCGNLKHFIGATLDETGYVRDRPFEFEGKLKTQEVIKEIEETIEVIKQFFPKLNEQQLTAEYPIKVFGETMSSSYFLMHLYGHLNYHLGQVNYHRRLINF